MHVPMAGAIFLPSTLVGMATPEPAFTQASFRFTPLSLCEIFPQKDREILRARSDVRGEQTSLCGAFKGPRLGQALSSTQTGLCSLQGAQLCPAGGGPHVHALSLLPPDTRAGPSGRTSAWHPQAFYIKKASSRAYPLPPNQKIISSNSSLLGHSPSSPFRMAPQPLSHP